MMTKNILPKLWLYVALVITLLSLSLVSCSQDVEDGEFDSTTTTTENKTDEKKEYTITFSPGSFAEGARYTVVKEPGQSVALNAVAYQRDGFVLSGWQEEEGAGEFYPIGYEFTEDRSITLYPVWKIRTYEVVLSPGTDGIGAPVMFQKTHATAMPLPNHTFLREGYSQVGWAVVDGGEQVFGLVGEYLDDRDITLFPVWQKNVYAVNFAPGKDVDGQIVTKNVLYGETLKLPSGLFTKNDYDLVGWSLEDGGTPAYAVSEDVVIKGDMTLYPVWELTKTFDIAPDYKKLPKTLMTTMNVADLALYFKLVNAFLNYENEVSFTTDTNPELVIQILQCYFPVMYADIDSDGPWIDNSDNKIRFDYVAADIDAHNERIDDFTKVLSTYLRDFNRTDTDVERALLLYWRLMTTVSYDIKTDLFPEEASAMKSSAYYTVMFELGRSDALASAYAFLLTQADIDAVLVNSDHKESGKAHYWVAIMLDFKWYYADIALDIGGQEFTHFGLSDSEMMALGYENAQNDAISAYTGNNIKDLIDTLDTRFHVFHGGAYTPTLDRDNDKVIFKDKNGTEVTFNIIENISR